MKPRIPLLFLCLLACLSRLPAQEEMVIFSAPGGFYEESFSLSLYCFYPNHLIRYTTNGNTPTSTSFLYTEPLTMNQDLFSNSNIYTIVNCNPAEYFAADNVKHAIVIRAAVFDENDSCISSIYTNSYFIRSLGCDTHGLPAFSIATDSLSLFDYETGIFIPGIHFNPDNPKKTGNYFQRGIEWERLVNMEYYELDNTGINQQCGLRTHGNASRRHQQKGMRFYAREAYGKKNFTHRFFESTTIEKFKRLSLHPFRCSHWIQTGAQEYMSQTVASNLNIDALGVRQTVVFLNGEYWGIYTLEESPDEHYLESHYDADPEQINIIQYWGVLEYGDLTDWRSIYAWLGTANLNQTQDSAYAYAHIDVPSFIDYMLFETYSANVDWPQNNVRQWQPESGAPFRWIFYDGDGCFIRPAYNAIEKLSTSSGCIRVFYPFLEHPYFRMRFYERYTQLLTSAFSLSYLRSVADHYRQLVEGEIESQSHRFGFPSSNEKWNSDMDKVDVFFQTRNEYYQQEIQYVIYSVTEHTTSRITCVPNPSSGSFIIHYQSDSNTIESLKIYDLHGHLVYSKTLPLSPSENRIPVNVHLASGLYLVTINNSVSKIMIE